MKENQSSQNADNNSSSQSSASFTSESSGRRKGEYTSSSLNRYKKRKASITTVSRDRNLKKASSFHPPQVLLSNHSNRTWFDPAKPPELDRLNLSFLSSSGTLGTNSSDSSFCQTSTETSTSISSSYDTNYSLSSNYLTEINMLKHHPNKQQLAKSKQQLLKESSGSYLPRNYSTTSATDSSTCIIESSVTTETQTQDMTVQNDLKAKKCREMEREKCNYGDVYCSETSILEKGFVIDDSNFGRSGERVISGYFYASPRTQILSAAAEK